VLAVIQWPAIYRGEAEPQRNAEAGERERGTGETETEREIKHCKLFGFAFLFFYLFLFSCLNLMTQFHLGGFDCSSDGGLMLAMWANNE